MSDIAMLNELLAAKWSPMLRARIEGLLTESS
jgi:hypothetical protein